jgi:DNA-binding transcriptional LysR family regulator
MAFSGESLQVFLAVLDHGSFSAAARALHRVPSAVSMAIAGLEAELDLELFDRSGREPKPTGAARALEAQARHAAAQFGQLEAQALALSEGLEQKLTIAVTPELSASRWCAALAKLGQEYPHLEVEVISATQEDALEMLNERAVNLALLFERPAMGERERFQEIGQECMVSVASASHRLATAQKIDLDTLLEERQIAVASRGDSNLNPRLVLSRKIWRADSYLATLALVQAGVGWAYLPEGLVGPLLQQKTLKKLDFANMTNELSLCVDVVWLRDRPMGIAAQRYIELIAAE